MFQVMHQGLGFKLELTYNPQWGGHCRKEALSHAALVDKQLSDGRDWLLGGDAPTFADITLCVAIAFSKYPTNNTPLDERSLVHRADLEAVAGARAVSRRLMRMDTVA